MLAHRYYYTKAFVQANCLSSWQTVYFSGKSDLLGFKDELGSNSISEERPEISALIMVI